MAGFAFVFLSSISDVSRFSRISRDSRHLWKESNDPWPQYFRKSIAIQMGAVSWYKLVVYILLSAKRTAYFCKSIAIEMGGVSRYFSRVLGSGADWTLLTIGIWAIRIAQPTSLAIRIWHRTQYRIANQAAASVRITGILHHSLFKTMPLFSHHKHRRILAGALWDKMMTLFVRLGFPITSEACVSHHVIFGVCDSNCIAYRGGITRFGPLRVFGIAILYSAFFDRLFRTPTPIPPKFTKSTFLHFSKEARIH